MLNLIECASFEHLREYISPAEMLAQLAEESAELAQAALKLRRALDGTNYTPKSVEDCKRCFFEEIADINVCISALIHAGFKLDYSYIYRMEAGKAARWEARLKHLRGGENSENS